VSAYPRNTSVAARRCNGVARKDTSGGHDQIMSSLMVPRNVVAGALSAQGGHRSMRVDDLLPGSNLTVVSAEMSTRASLDLVRTVYAFFGQKFFAHFFAHGL